jgi:hypothetical protein
MSRNRALLYWAPCFVVILAFSSPVLRANGQAGAPVPSDKDYHEVTVKNGKKTAVIRVKDQIGPRLHGELPSNGVYSPTNLDLGRSSSFSNKEFTVGNSSLSKTDTAEEALSGNRFVTKSFSLSKSDSMADVGKTYKTSSFTESARGSNDYQGKTFATSASTMTQGKDAAFEGAGKTSTFQGQTAVLDGDKKTPFSGTSDLNDKTFSDPEMKHIRRDPYSTGNNLDVKRLTDLPNRPLTIKEVRNLINHETVPNLNEKADDDLKSLNDPEYEPPAPFKDYRPKQLPAEEKDNGLPSPGMMATPTPPENGQPLPK